MALRTGLVVNDYHVVLIDIDDKNENGILNGMSKWNILIKHKNINTPTQKTGNNGLHYLFKVPSNIFEILPASITGLYIEGKKYSINFKGKNQFVIVEPSEYQTKNING